MELYKPPKHRLQKELNKKKARLVELEKSYRNATNPRSKSSFKGKVTNCKQLIKTLEARIKRLYG